MIDRAAPEYRGAQFTKSFAALSCLLGAVVGTVAMSHAGLAANALQRAPGIMQPGFALRDSTGSEIALAAAPGQIVLVHFFATWCEPCREELPALSRLAARGKGTVRVLAISVDEPDLRVRRFLDTMPLAFPVLLDRDRAVAKGWNVATLPTTFVLDANLHPRLQVETDFAWDDIDPATLVNDVNANPTPPKSTPLGG